MTDAVFWRDDRDGQTELPEMVKSWPLLLFLSVLVSGKTDEERSLADCDEYDGVPWNMCDGSLQAYSYNGSDLRHLTLCLGAVENEVSYKNDGCFKDRSCDLMLIAHPCLTTQKDGSEGPTWSFEVYANVSVPHASEDPNPTGDQNAVSEGEVSWIQMMFSEKKIESFIQDPMYTPIQEGDFVAGDPKPRLRSYFHAENKTFIPITPVSSKDKLKFTPVLERSVIIRPNDGQVPADKSYQRFVFYAGGMVRVDFTHYYPDSSRSDYQVNFHSYTTAVFPYVIQYRQAVRYTADETFELQGPPVTGNIIRLKRGIHPLMKIDALNPVVREPSIPRTRYDVRMPDESVTTAAPEKSKSMMIIIVVVAVILILVLVFVVICCVRRRHQSGGHQSPAQGIKRTRSGASSALTDEQFNRSTMDNASMVMMPVDVLPSTVSSSTRPSPRKSSKSMNKSMPAKGSQYGKKQ